MSKKDFVIFGGGGFAREVACYVDQKKYKIVGFYDIDVSSPKSLNGYPIFDSLAQLKGVEFIAAVGDPVLRKRLIDEGVNQGLMPCSPILAPGSFVGVDVEIGNGSVLCPGAVITCNARIGMGFIMNLHSTVGHDCRIGDYVTLSPGANVSGRVELGRGVYVGTNAAIREHIRVGPSSVVGMGAVVVKDIPEGITVVGNPAHMPRAKAA